MKLVCISDTHGRHERLHVSACDVLVHCGDATRRGHIDELERTLAWMGRQPAEHRIFVAGNHDLCCEAEPERTVALAHRHGIELLCDEGTTLAGLTFWGSPVTPRFRDMAYNRERGAAIAEHWAKIPAGLDVLVTHGPPRGLGDRIIVGLRVGCADLRARVQQVPPRLHLFGHIHEAAGEYAEPGLATRFINVASSRLLPMVRTPVVVELPAAAAPEPSSS